MEDKYLFVLLGGVAWIAATKYFPQLKELSGSMSIKQTGCSACKARGLYMKELESISGLDVNSWKAARSKGFI